MATKHVINLCIIIGQSDFKKILCHLLVIAENSTMMIPNYLLATQQLKGLRASHALAIQIPKKSELSESFILGRALNRPGCCIVLWRRRK